MGNITRSVYSDGTGTAEEKYTYGRGGNLMTFGNERTGGYKGGNPGLYLGNKLTWTRGRQLSSVKHKNKKSAHSVSEDISYTYTHEGIRLSKTVGETKTEYILDGSTILAEKRGNEVLNYYYSSDGRLLEIGYTKDSSKADALENHYTILRNAMGDVAGLLTPDGTLVGTYEYDPYGRLISITHSNSYTDTDGILERNPFRYRGYYYDNETGWYYLQSRYYDPEVKRFINADTPDLLTNDCMNLMQYNLFMYCNGDPVNNTDYSGHLSDIERLVIMTATIAALAAVVVLTGGTGAIAIGAAIGVAGGAAIGFGAAGIASILNGNDSNKVISDATDGLIIGGAIGTGAGIACGTVATYSVPAMSQISGVGNPVPVLGRGSTGRTEPLNIYEQMSMHQIMSNPLDGAKQLPTIMNDSRWPSSDGWVKMQNIVKHTGGQTSIHFVYNIITHEFDDFKFKY